MDSDKIKIFIFGRDKVRWSIDKDRKAVIYFLKKNNFEITKNIFKSTHIFCVWYDLLLSLKYYWLQVLRKVLKLKIIAVITNDISFCPKKINIIEKYVDTFISPSVKIYSLLKKKGLRIYRIPFFVNPKIFKSLNINKKDICKKLNINWRLLKDRIVIGSFQRDSLGSNLSKPKWQKNPELLIEILKKLPREKIILLLAGPRRHYIINRCIQEKINFLFYGDYSYIKARKDDILVNNLSLEKINYLYNLTDVYIVTSKSEGGPKAVLESALTKTLIFSTKVGLAPDILHPYLLFEENKIQSLIEKIKKFFEQPMRFDKYIDFNFQKAREEMALNTLREKYRKVILED